MSQTPWQRAITVGLACTVIVAGVLSRTIYLGETSAARSEMRTEMFAQLTQLVVIVIAGGAVAFAFKRMEKAADEAKEGVRLRQQYVARLGNTYRSVKELRRLLRSAGLTREYGVATIQLSGDQVVAYDTHMRTLNRAQLELEALKIEFENFIIDEGLAELILCIGDMEVYLKIVLREFEQMRPKASLNFEHMPALDEFTRDSSSTQWNTTERNTFFGSFVSQHKCAIAILSGHAGDQER